MRVFICMGVRKNIQPRKSDFIGVLIDSITGSVNLIRRYLYADAGIFEGI